MLPSRGRKEFIAVPVYSYQARDPLGKKRTGVIEAENPVAVVDALAQRGCIATRVKPKLNLLPRFGLGQFGRGTVKRRDLVVFTRQFSSLIKAGIPLNRALQVLKKQTSSRRLQQIVSEIQKDINRGQPLYAALSQHPGVFDKLYLQMIKTGEVAGSLDSVLEKLTDVIQKELTLRSRIKAAVMYPLMVVLIALGIVAFMLIFVLPGLVGTFIYSGMALPRPTQILLGIAGHALDLVWLLPAGGLLVWIMSRWFKQTPKGGMLINRLVFKLPIFGNLVSQITTARFAGAMAVLLSSGVPVIQTLEIVEGTLTNRAYKEAVVQIRHSIAQGRGIAGPLLAAGFFEPVLIQMISVGEETGNLDTMLVQVARHCENEVDLTVGSLIPLIEPLLILIVAAMVGFIVFSVFLPMLNLIAAPGINL